MQKIVCFLFFLFSINFNLKSQIDFIGIDCAHGHNCCSIACKCCKELSRPQVYDTILLSKKNHVSRKIIVEKYQYSNSKNKYPVRISFVNNTFSDSFIELYSIPNLDYFSEYSSFYANTKSKLDLLIDKFEKNGKIYVCDDEGNYFFLNSLGQKIDAEYHLISKISDKLKIGIVKSAYSNQIALLDSNSKELSNLRYQAITNLINSNYFLIRDFTGKFGLVNETGELIFPCKYDVIKSLNYNLFALYEGEFVNIVDEQNNIINKEKIIGVNEFSNGLSEVTNEKKEKYFIDTLGNKILSHQFQTNNLFHDGFCMVYKDKKFGFIDKTGQLKIDFLYDNARNFHQGVAPVCIGQNSNTDKWGLIDQKGKFITETKYDEIEDFKNGLARTFINGVGYGFIDVNGKEVFKSIYRIDGFGTKDDYFIDGVLIRSTIRKEKSLELVNRDGKQILDLSQYSHAHFITNSKVPYTYFPYIEVYESDTIRNLIDFKGNKIFKYKYQLISLLNEEVAFVKTKNSQKLIRISDEKVLLDFGINKIEYFDGYFYTVIVDNEKEIYNIEGVKIE